MPSSARRPSRGASSRRSSSSRERAPRGGRPAHRPRLLHTSGDVTRSIRIDFDEAGHAEAPSFALRTGPGPGGDGHTPFRLPMRRAGVLARPTEAAEERDAGGERTLPLTWVTDAHARRVGWRQVRDWLAAQLALIDVGLAALPEVMLPYELVPAAGRDGEPATLDDAWRRRKALPAPDAGERPL